MRIVLVLLLIAAVAAAVTDQGRLMLTKAGAIVGLYPPVLTIDVRRLDRNLAQAALESGGFNGVAMKCQAEPPGTLGDTSCAAMVSLINEIPAYNAAFFFKSGRLSAVRLAFQVESQQKLDQYMRQEFAGGETKAPPANASGEMPLYILPVENGTVMTSQEHTQLDELILLWVPEVLPAS